MCYNVITKGKEKEIKTMNKNEFVKLVSALTDEQIAALVEGINEISFEMVLFIFCPFRISIN